MENKFADLAIIFALILSILSAAVPLLNNMNNVIKIILVFLGIIVGIYNLEETEKNTFLFGGIGILIATNFLIPQLQNVLMMNIIISMLEYLSIFIASAISLAFW